MIGPDGRAAFTEPERATQASPIATVYAARALRDFGDGFVAVLLPVYLTALGLGAFEVGLVATLALLGLGADDARHWLPGRKGGSTPAAAGSEHPDDRHRRRLCQRRDLRGAAAGGFRRHDQPIVRQRQHLRPIGACAAVALGRGRRPHQNVRALQSDRRACCGRGLARLGQSRPSRRPRRVEHRRAQGHVCRLCDARCSRWSSLCTHSTSPGTRRRATGGRARAVTWHRLQDGGALQHRCLRRWFRGAVADRVVAVQQVRLVALCGRLCSSSGRGCWQLSRFRLPRGCRVGSAS